MQDWTILIVNPQQKDQQIFKRQLADFCQVRFAATSSDAIRILNEENILLVFSAHQLVDVSGFEFLNCLKENFPHLPAVITACKPDTAILLATLRHGAWDFLEMPCKKEELENIIHKALNNLKRSAGQEIPALYPDERFRGVISHFWDALCSGGGGNSREDVAVDLAALQIADPLAKATASDGESPSGHDMAVYFLGHFRIEVDGRRIEQWPGHKGKQLLAYLLANRKRHIHREQLMSMFWPDSTQTCAKNSLNVALCGLRKLFNDLGYGKDVISFRNDCYFLHPELTIWVDVEAFRRHCNRGQSLDQIGDIPAMINEYKAAIELYKGDFIEEDRYEDWSDLERENLLETYLVILSRLSYYYSINGKPRTAITLCDRVLRRDQCREDIHRRVMFCYYRLGQRDRSIRQYQKCRKVLDTELGVVPTRTTSSLYERICNGDQLDAAIETDDYSEF